MVNLEIPPKHIEIFAVCIDDEKPKFHINNWIEKNKWYRVRGFTEPLNISDGKAVIIYDSKGNEIHPSESHWSFSANRFDYKIIVLN
jgi:hypothetical protein